MHIIAVIAENNDFSTVVQIILYAVNGPSLTYPHTHMRIPTCHVETGFNSRRGGCVYHGFDNIINNLLSFFFLSSFVLSVVHHSLRSHIKVCQETRFLVSLIYASRQYRQS